MSDSGLGVRDSADVLEALGALRVATEPVRCEALRATREPALRETLEQRLKAAGRVLLDHDGGRVSIAFADEISDELADAGIGTLDPVDRAVLCLALVHCVAAPRARGAAGGDLWHVGQRISVEALIAHRPSQPTGEQIVRGVRRLKDLGLLRAGRDIAPGPALARLTPRVRGRLWEDLVLIASPDSVRARYIRQRREEAP